MRYKLFYCSGLYCLVLLWYFFCSCAFMVFFFFFKEVEIISF